MCVCERERGKREGRWALRCDGAGPGTEGPAEPVGSAYSHGLSSEELGLLSSELFPQAGLLAPLTDGETEAEGGGDGQVPWGWACPTQAAWLASGGPGLTLPRVQCVRAPVQEAGGGSGRGRRCRQA